jgi:hypothetical protein
MRCVLRSMRFRVSTLPNTPAQRIAAQRYICDGRGDAVIISSASMVSISPLSEPYSAEIHRLSRRSGNADTATIIRFRIFRHGRPSLDKSRTFYPRASTRCPRRFSGTHLERATFRPPLTTLPPKTPSDDQCPVQRFLGVGRCGSRGDVCFGLLQKNRKRHNGPPLSTGASLYARSWAEMV